MHRPRLVLAIVLTLLVADHAAAEKRLRWTNLDVHASLDRDGLVRVVEKHRIVFDGDWNGGERRFRPRFGQKIQLLRLTRMDGDLVSHPLRPGDLDSVDEYAWHDNNTLRWRSRLPSDPPFLERELIYAIEYSVANLLQPAGGEYLLDHDFAFPDRDGVIERFTLRLDLDPVWASAGTSPVRLERSRLEPGQGVVVLIPLRYSAAGRPASVPIGTAVGIRIAMAILFVGCVAFLLFRWFTEERKTGRFEPLPTGDVNREWLEKNLLQHPPEVVGAAWDDSTGAPEVAAVLARMAGEKKLESRVEKLSWLREELFLTLLVPRESLEGYEARLVKALFFKGETTSTALIREHYRKKGFDPVAMIRAPVTKLASRLAGGKKRRAPLTRLRRTSIVFAVAIALLISTAWQGQHDQVGAAVAGAILIVLFILGITSAFEFAKQVVNLKLHALKIAFPLTLIVAGVLLFLLKTAAVRPLGILVLAGTALLGIAIIMLVLNLSRTTETPEGLQLRRRLAAAREWFKRELRNPNPLLDDQWFPYLLAFGLGSHVDRWFRAFGSAANVGSVSSSGSFSGSSSPATTSGWTGGGGAFGGAGGTGSWAAAAGSMAAGVSAPGGSGGGSGGSSGGSSGGGGGGGW